MARSHLILAALASSVVPGFDPTGSQSLSTGTQGEFDTALVRAAAGAQYVVRVPTSAGTTNDLINQTVALTAMTQGVRSRLGFDVPNVIGRAPLSDTFGVVFDFLPGRIISLADFDQNFTLSMLVGRATASIHQLPTGFVAEAGLPVFSAAETQRQSAELVGRGRATGLLPAALVARWDEAIADDTLWQFEPTVIHGSLGVDRFVIGEDSVTGVLGWGSMRVGDPAWDLHWVISLDSESQAEAFGSYTSIRLSSVDPKIRQRAVLYSELELMRWLMHGVELQRQDIIDDAVALLDRLVDTVREEETNTVGQEEAPVLNVSEVESLLASTPEIEDAPANETAEVFAPTEPYSSTQEMLFPSPAEIEERPFADESGHVYDEPVLSQDEIATAPTEVLGEQVDENGAPRPERDAPRWSDEPF